MTYTNYIYIYTNTHTHTHIFNNDIRNNTLSKNENHTSSIINKKQWNYDFGTHILQQSAKKE
jgi:hypothetical protein